MANFNGSSNSNNSDGGISGTGSTHGVVSLRMLMAVCFDVL